MIVELVVAALVGGVAAPEVAAVPSGMDLLYSERVAFAPSGEPIVTIGLMTGQEQVAVRSEAAMQIDFYEAGVWKRAGVRAGAVVSVRMKRSTPAAQTHYVDLEGVGRSDGTRLTQALAGWRARGYPGVQALEEGTVLGMTGHVLDNRMLRLTLAAKSAADADRLVAEVYERFGVHAEARARLLERPWGELFLSAGGAPLGVATSYIRFAAPAGLVQVRSVEFGEGYAWHGREDRSYRGEIYVVVDPSGRLAAVNVLGAEAVLEGVVPSEMFASSPPEALKAQAVAARNHLLSQLGRRHFADPFHLCSEQHCQVYSGVGREDPRTTAAVRATAGEALFHDGRMVEAVYSSNCGGHTEDNDAVWGDSPNAALRGQPDFDVADHPELARFAAGIAPADMAEWLALQPDAYCTRAARARPDKSPSASAAAKFRWQKSIAAPELGKLLATQLRSIGRLRDLRVDERGAGGRVISLRLVGGRGETVVLRELPIRKLFGNLSSGAFTVDVAKDTDGFVTQVTFKGAGWGHGVGMCQLGAIGRAEAGQSYREILGHYYGGASVRRLYQGQEQEPETAAR